MADTVLLTWEQYQCETSSNGILEERANQISKVKF